MSRALSMNDLYNKRYNLLDFEGSFYNAFSKPERSGVWFIWGNSGNGKTAFAIQLVKYLSNYGRVAYNSMEESSSHTIQEAFIRNNMAEVGSKVVLLENEPLNELEERLKRRKCHDIIVIDSLQYSRINWEAYQRMKEANRGKLIIFISHADGKSPEGRVAKRIMHDAGLKIWVEGYRAHSKGRYIGPNDGIYTIWNEGAVRYWGEN